MRVLLTKGAGRRDRLTCIRPNGSRTTADSRRPGQGRRDAAQLIVEQVLGLRRAFYGRISAGASVDEMFRRVEAHDGSAATRASALAPELIEWLQAERIADCFYAELVAGPPLEESAFRTTVQSACESSGVFTPWIGSDELESIRARLGRFDTAWEKLGPERSVEFEFARSRPR